MINTFLSYKILISRVILKKVKIKFPYFTQSLNIFTPFPKITEDKLNRYAYIKA